MTEESEDTGSEGEDEPSAEGRDSADEVAQELKEHENEIEEGDEG